MNVLEKILEKIEKVEEDYTHEEHSLMFCMGACSIAAYIKEIIRSHMNEIANMCGKRLIDANALDDEVMRFFLDITGNPKQTTVVRECKESFRRMIDEQPTIYTDDGWIPVSKCLPDESDYYMVCVYNEEVEDYDFRKAWFAHIDDYDMEESEWREIYNFERVIAWQPLPEPYKESK